MELEKHLSKEIGKFLRKNYSERARASNRPNITCIKLHELEFIVSVEENELDLLLKLKKEPLKLRLGLKKITENDFWIKFSYFLSNKKNQITSGNFSVNKSEGGVYNRIKVELTTEDVTQISKEVIDYVVEPLFSYIFPKRK